MSLYIVTLAEMKAELGLTDTTDDAVLTRWMEGLQGRFDQFTNRRFLRTEGIVETFDGDESFLYLANFPVESITDLRIDPAGQFGAATVMGTDRYRLNAERGLVAYGPVPGGYAYGASASGLLPWPVGSGTMRWPTGFQNIRVTYTGGFVACDGTVGAGQFAMPEAVRRGFFLQLGFEWRNRLNLGKSSVSAQGQSVQIAEARWLPEVKQLLQQFMRFV